MKHTFVCGGLRSDSFLGYLKTLGVFRKFALACDATARFALKPDGAVVTSERSREDFDAYFLNEYAPTPVVNPWNKGGGIINNPKRPSAFAIMRQVEEAPAPRWSLFRDSIRAARDAVKRAKALNISKESKEKGLIASLYRATCPEEALAWLDTAAVIGLNEAYFNAYIVGSGGNDGSLDFGVMFAGYALAMMDGKPGRGVDREALLQDSLNGTTSAQLVSGSLGQYSPAAAVMFNLGNGALGDGLANPWDYLFALEGAVAFAGALVKRANATDRPSYSFSFSSVAAGFGSASSGEDTRGEIWLPVWTGAASWPAVSALLRRGRLEVDVSSSHATAARSARNSLDAVHGALTLGVASGVDRLERIVLAARNGLAYAGTSAGPIYVGDRRDAAIASLNRETLQWVARTKNLKIGARAHDALRVYENAIFAYGAMRMDDLSRKIAFQEVIASLGDVDRTVALGPPADHRPLPFLDATLLVRDGPLDDGSAEHRIARSLASLGDWRSNNPKASLRFDVIGVRHGDKGLVFGSDRTTLWRIDTKAMLASIAARRTRDVASAKAADAGTFLLHASSRARLRDFELMLADEIDWDRLGRLVLGYSLVHPAPRTAKYEHETGRSDPALPRDQHAEAAASKKRIRDVAHLPSAFAILKLAVDRVNVPGSHRDRPPLDVEIVPLLLANAGERALEMAARRLRATGFVPRDVRELPVDDPLLYASALLVPGSGRFRRRCIASALRVPPETSE